MHIKKRSVRVVFTLFTLSLFACTRNVDTLLPGPADAGVNFYNAAETLNAVDSLRVDNYVFIDDSTQKYPPIFDRFAKDGREYPEPIGIGQPGGSYSFLDYMRLSAGRHRLMFTGRKAISLLMDTAMDFQPGTFSCVYLTESMVNDSAYRLVSALENRKSPAAGKVGVRIIVLCPDISALNSALINKDGSTTTTGMAQNMMPGTVTPYAELDTAAAIHNKLFINFFTGNDKDNPLVTAAVPAESGRCFVILVQGFSKAATRRIVTKRNADGSPGYNSVNVSPNLRVNIRAAY